MRLHRFAASRHSANQASILALHFTKLRKGRLEADFAHITGIDTGQERLGHILQHFCPQPPLDQFAQRFIFIAPARRKHEVQHRPHLAAERDQAALKERLQFRRNS
ncbi:hypothetical protein D3C75_1054240 [compost metagenome]